MKQMHADLVKLGYEGSYARVAAFARAWREDRHRVEQTTGRGTFDRSCPVRIARPSVQIDLARVCGQI